LVNQVFPTDFLEIDPLGRRGLFEAQLQRFQRPGFVTPFNRQNFSNQFQNIENQFLGRTVSDLQAGRQPQTFSDALNDLVTGRSLRRLPTYK
jgi:hypothetical protein